MSDTNTIDSSLANGATFNARLAALDGMPEWLSELKKGAWEKFNSLPMPSRTNENWRFGTYKDLDVDGYDAGICCGEIAREVEIKEFSARIDFAEDTELSSTVLDDSYKAKGVIFMPLREAIFKHSDLVKQHLFERLPEIGSEKFEALHQALFTNGTFLYVPKGVTIEKPFIAVHNATREASAQFPHTLMVLEENAEATLLDFFTGNSSDSKNFVCAMADLYAGQASRLNYRAVQDWSLDTLAFHLNSMTAEKDAFIKAVTVNLGGRHIRNEQHGRILGKGADVNMHSLGVVKGKQELDQRTLQTHIAGESRSDLLFKNALLDEARTVFSGLIKVEEDAQQTDAYQTNRNLLCSAGVDANSLPGLEIKANDVKCSHGATSGQIDESELFYFLARGIPRQKARELLVFGFFEEIIEKFDNECLAEFVRELVQHKFID